MAKIDSTSRTSGKNSGRSIGDVRSNIKRLQEGQTQLVNQVDNLTLALNSFLEVQTGLNTQIAILTRQCLEELSNGDLYRPVEGPNTIAEGGSASMPIAPCPNFTAGPRLVNTSELLTMNSS